MLLVACALSCGGTAARTAAETTPSTIRGLPITRFYAFDQIGDIARNPQLSFDEYGRIVAVSDGVYEALDDDVWLDLSARPVGAVHVEAIARDADGALYFGALGTWGRLTQTPDGKFTPSPFAPRNVPDWVSAGSFVNVVCQSEGIYFANMDGVARWDRTTRRTSYLELPGLVTIFNLEGSVYASVHGRGVVRLDYHAGALTAASWAPFAGAVIDRDALIDNFAPLVGGGAAISTTSHRLLLYQNGRLAPMPGAFARANSGRISTLLGLPDGLIAVSLAGRGLYFLTREGRIDLALTGQEYHRISALAANERGVLWAATETGVVKILYGSPVAQFGQSLGLPVSWPQLIEWNGRLVVASSGQVYEQLPVGPGEPAHFRAMEGCPRPEIWGIASSGQWLLLANSNGAYAKLPGHPFVPVLSHLDVSRLVELRSGVCLAIGADQIAALHCVAGHWSECAPRIAGIGFPSLVHAAGDAVWIELGVNRAARLALKDGKLRVRVFDDFPWVQPSWVNVSVIGHIAILSGTDQGRVYFDETTEKLVAHPAVDAVLAAAPFWAPRYVEDREGRLWGSYSHGIFTLTPTPRGWVADASTYWLINEHIPIAHELPETGIWITDGHALVHVSSQPAEVARPPFSPVLVSVRDIRTDHELLGKGRPVLFARALSYRQNGLLFRFFAGTYAWRRTPGYQFRMGDDDEWRSLDSMTLLRLSDLHEGRYDLQVRLSDAQGPLGPIATVRFAVEPPLYRTWYAYLTYALLAAGFIFALVRRSVREAETKNLVLEQMVASRTAELKATMQKLQQETRASATLAERNRLAGELHDSLEQGFSALSLQLETTAALANCPLEVRAGLAVARNMAAFSRNELRHAVWNLHSPMLETGGLEAALKQVVKQMAPGHTQASVSLAGVPRDLGSAVEHNLLRIAQEATANAVKHSGASRLDVRLAFTDSEVELAVSDDGRGFEPNSVLTRATGHFGLRGLRSRARKIGGTLHIASRPGQGTKISIRVPSANASAI